MKFFAKVLFVLMLILSVKWNSAAQTHTFVDTTSAQTLSGPKTLTTPIIGYYTVSTLPAPSILGRIAIVTDGTTGGDCTIGGGAALVWCRENGVAWSNVGGGSTLCSTIGANTYYAVAGYTPACDASIIDSGSGMLTLNSLATNSDGVHPAQITMIGNTTLPSLPANTFQMLGPNTSSFTSYGIQWPTTGPSGISIALYGTPSSSISPISFHAIPQSAAVLSTDSSSGPTAATPHQVALPLQCTDTSASATAYTCTTTPSVGSLISGDAFIFSAINQNNSGSATLNINGIGAKAIKKWQGTANLVAGDLQSGNAVWLIYDGTSFEVQTIGNAPGTPALTNTHIFVGNVSNVATDVAMSGDATMANTGALTLKNTGTAGSCGDATHSCSLTFDAQGRETAQSNVAITAGTINNALQFAPSYYSAAGTANTLSGLPPPTTDGSTPYLEVWTPNSSNVAVAPTFAPAGVPVDAEAGATYTIAGAGAKTDRASLVNNTNNTTSTAVTVPQASAAGFDFNFPFVQCNQGSVVVTDTPTTSTVNGNSTLKLLGIASGNNPECAFWWNDGTNWFAAEILPTDANGLLHASGFPALTGDVTNTGGSLATTVGKVNGAIIPTSSPVLASNSSKQIISATPHNVVTPLQCADTSASATTYTCTTTPSLASLAAGDAFIFTTINQNNSGSATLNIDAIGAKTIKKWQNTANLAAGDLQASASVLVTYDGTNFEIDTIGNAPTGTGLSAATYYYTPQIGNSGMGATTNTTSCNGWVVPQGGLSVGHIGYQINTPDNTNFSDIGIYNSTGTLLGNVGAQHFASATQLLSAFVQGTISIPAGKAYICFTSSAGTVNFGGANAPSFFTWANVSGTTTGGALNSSITPPADSVNNGANKQISFVLYP